MILGCLDTSTDMASFSLYKEDEEVISVSKECRRGASKLLPWINELIREKGFSTSEVNEWRVGIGPGSFTGMRVGIAFVKGICYASGASFCGVNSGYGFVIPVSENNENPQIISVLHDGRRKEVIANTFSFIDSEWTEKGTEVLKISDLPEKKEDLGLIISNMSEEAFDEEVRSLIQFTEAIKADSFKKVSVKPLASLEEMDLSCEPIYVRPPVFI